MIENQINPNDDLPGINSSYSKYIQEFKNFIHLSKKSVNANCYFEILEVLSSFNDKNILLSFIFFSKYKKWFNPKIFQTNNNTKLYSVNEKTLIFFHYFLFYKLSRYSLKGNSQKMNEILYLYKEINEKLIELFDSMYLSINQIINLMDFYLLFLEYFNDFSKRINISEKSKKIIIFFILKNFFFILKKVIIICFAKINCKKYDIKIIQVLTDYLDKIVKNEDMKKEINIILLNSKNIIQNFFQELIMNVNFDFNNVHHQKFIKFIIQFCVNFFKYKYKLSNIFDLLISNVKNAFEHLYNFEHNKEYIFKDIVVQNIYLNLLKELFYQQNNNFKNRNTEKIASGSYFLFTNEKSIISFSINDNDLYLEKKIFFLSFRIHKNTNIGQILPLLNINNIIKDIDLELNVYLKPINEENNQNYYLCFSGQKKEKVIINEEKDNYIISNDKTYYLSFYINKSKLKVFLYHEFSEKHSNEVFIKTVKFTNFIINPIITIGNFENSNEYFQGILDTIILAENKTNVNIDPIIQRILLSKEKYKNFIFSKENNSFELIRYFENGTKEENENSVTNENSFNCFLYLSPENFNNIYFNNDNVCDNKLKLPINEDICNLNISFNLHKLNISIIKYENINEEFIKDNGPNFLCLQLEYFNQFINYYIIKSNNNKNIFNEDQKTNIIHKIKESINIILSLMCNNNYLILYESYKRIFMVLYECLKNLKKICDSIIEDFFFNLCLLIDVYRGHILNRNILDKNSELNEKDGQRESLLSMNISIYIGLIELVLSNEFYRNTDIDSIKKVFKYLQNKINLEGITDIDISSYENIFNRLLGMEQILVNEKIINENFEELLQGYFTLFSVFICGKNNMNNYKKNEIYFHKLFRFIFGNNIDNKIVIYSYINFIYYSCKKEYKLIINEEEINFLLSYLKILNKEKQQNVIINDYEIQLIKKSETIIIYLLLKIIFTREDIKIFFSDSPFDFLLCYTNDNSLIKNSFDFIKNIIDNYFTIEFKKDKNNVKMDITMKKFYNLFNCLFILLKILITSNDEKLLDYYFFGIINVLLNIQTNIEINLNNNIIENQIICCIINFVKFISNIFYDKNLNWLIDNKAFLSVFEGLINYCYNSTIINTNIYIKIKYNDDYLYKTIIETILDLFMEYINSKCHFIINNKNTEINYCLLQRFCPMLLELFFIKSSYKNFNNNKNIRTILTKLKHNSEISLFFINDYFNISQNDNKFLTKINDKKINEKLKIFKKINSKILKCEKKEKFAYYFCSFFLLKIDAYKMMIDGYLKDNYIQNSKEFYDLLLKVNNYLLELFDVLIDDHKKLNYISNGCFSKIKINNNIFKKLIPIIQDYILKENNEQNTQTISEIIKNQLLNNNFQKDALLFNFNSRNLLNKNFQKLNSNDDLLNRRCITFEENLKDYERERINSFIPVSTTMNTDEINIKEEYNNNFIYINENDNSINERINLDEIIIIEKISPLKNIDNEKCIFNEIDLFYMKNLKKELMKNVFSVYFENSFYNDEIFESMKKIYLNIHEKAEPSTKLLKYPTKIKNFTNGLETPLLLKDNKNFYISEIFPISHSYFYKYMITNNIKFDKIYLIKKNINIQPSIENKGNKNFFDINCEIVKIDHAFYGHLVNYAKEGFLLFEQKKFELDKNLINNMISISFITEMLSKNNNVKLENKLCDKDIEKQNKNNKYIIIFYSEIEEILERRFILSWQSIEIFLKNGKSYFINLLNNNNYSNFISKIKNFNETQNIPIRSKDFLMENKIISEHWIEGKLDTYEYLLLLNKYGSRSFNDNNQYYIFPWLLNDYDLLLNINKNKEDILNYILEKNKNNSKQQENKYCKNLRKLKYPVNAQIEENRIVLYNRYNDDLEKFPFHSGTHYSTSSYIFFYLMRLEPYSTLLIELQNYIPENPDRELRSIKELMSTLKLGNDPRECIPEFFNKIDQFINLNCDEYGTKSNGLLVDDIIPINFPEFNDDNLSLYVKFIIEHKKLLNSKLIAFNLPKWIDNIFGVNQLPPKAQRLNCYNIFPKETYEQETNLPLKITNKYQKLLINNTMSLKTIKDKLSRKMNTILSFGQTPYQIFKSNHKLKITSLDLTEKIIDKPKKNEEDLFGIDDINTMVSNLRNDNQDKVLKIPSIFFEINNTLNKIIILGVDGELEILNTNIYDENHNINYIYFKRFNVNNLKIPKFENLLKENIYEYDYYIYKFKYAFSSFVRKENNPQKEKFLYYDKYIENLKEEKKKQLINETENNYLKFISCRYLDNSFKIHKFYIKGNKTKNEEKQEKIITKTYKCEDFVMSCCTIDSQSFLIGLKNGKLLKLYIDNEEKIDVKNYIQGLKGEINFIEIEKKLGLVIIGGGKNNYENENKVYIRKLYDFELLTSIKLKNKYIISMAKISPAHFLYILCYNKNKKKSVIFGYTLSGIRFAKSSYSYFTNIDFTKSGNLVSLINQNEIRILLGNDLTVININKKDKDFEEYCKLFKKIFGAVWMQFNYLKRNSQDEDIKIISFIIKEKAGKKKKDNKNIDDNEEKYHFKTIEVNKISYFD